MDLLNGVRVLDLTRVLAGPYCTMILGDLGAEIVKIERPGTGDDSRHFGPFYKGESAYYKSINRNKKSITLNLKTGEGKDIFKKLLKNFDVVVENYRPGTMEKLGLGFDVIKEINPDIIYASVSGFGHTGPYSDRPAYDAVVQAMGGLMGITGAEGGPPTRVGSSIGDITAGLYCAIGIMASLYKRKSTCVPEKVDISMLDCQISLLENAIARYSITGQVPGPNGNRHSSIVPFETFETSDGDLMLAIGNDKLWGTFCSIIGRDDLSSNERFATNDKRNENYSELKAIMTDIMKGRTTDDWVEFLNKHYVPNSPVNSIRDVIENEQVTSRNMIVEEELEDGKVLKVASSPLKVGEMKLNYIKAPTLGADTSSVLKDELDLEDNEINELLNRKII